MCQSSEKPKDMWVKLGEQMEWETEGGSGAGRLAESSGKEEARKDTPLTKQKSPEKAPLSAAVCRTVVSPETRDTGERQLNKSAAATSFY